MGAEVYFAVLLPPPHPSPAVRRGGGVPRGGERGVGANPLVTPRTARAALRLLPPSNAWGKAGMGAEVYFAAAAAPSPSLPRRAAGEGVYPSGGERGVAQIRS